MGIEIAPAGIADQPTIANLFQLYYYEFSEILGYGVDSSGRFVHPDISGYWGSEGRFPFLFKFEGLPAGFALVDRGSAWTDDPEVFDMAEFFVLQGVRRHGIGPLIDGR